MIESIHWHTLHPRYLDHRSKVIDIGANIGQFSCAMVKRFGCQCIAIEPAPDVFRMIPDDPNITKIQAAVAQEAGAIQLYVATKSDSHSTISRADAVKTIEVESISLPTLLDRLKFDRIDLLKIDVEGAEISILEYLSDEYLRRIAQITIEFHDFCGLVPEEDVHRILQRLREVGFYSTRMSGVGHQDTWLINRRLLRISLAELLFSKYIVRNWRGGKRVAARWLAKFRQIQR